MSTFNRSTIKELRESNGQVDLQLFFVYWFKEFNKVQYMFKNHPQFVFTVTSKETGEIFTTRVPWMWRADMEMNRLMHVNDIGKTVISHIESVKSTQFPLLVSIKPNYYEATFAPISQGFSENGILSSVAGSREEKFFSFQNIWQNTHDKIKQYYLPATTELSLIMGQPGSIVEDYLFIRKKRDKLGFISTIKKT